MAVQVAATDLSVLITMKVVGKRIFPNYTVTAIVNTDSIYGKLYTLKVRLIQNCLDMRKVRLQALLPIEKAILKWLMAALYFLDEVRVASATHAQLLLETESLFELVHLKHKNG